MSRRSTSQQKLDDAAFPIRVKFVVPPDGLGAVIDEMRQWLRSEIGTGQFATHAATGIGCSGVAFYFRTLDEARRFREAFPQVALADGTASIAYTSPLGRKRG